MGKPANRAELSGDVAVNENEGPVVVRLNLSAELYEAYKELAEKQDLTAAELMSHRLQRCIEHSSIRSIYLPETQVRQIEGILQKRPLETADQLLALMAEAFRFRVDGFEPITITPQRAKRIYLGAIGGYTPQQKLAAIFEAAVAKATGI